MTRNVLENAVRPIFQTNPQISMSISGWLDAQEGRGEKVEWTRRYFDGDHDHNLTENLKKSLRISSGLDYLNDNRMRVVVNTMNDRLRVEDFDTDDKTLAAWGEQLRINNRFDALQNTVHEALLVDGDTFLMLEWDKESKQVRWTHEPAYDGVAGVVAVYINRQMVAALKLWHIIEENDEAKRKNMAARDDVLYVNAYFPDRIEKYTSRSSGPLQKRLDEDGEYRYAWEDKQRQPLGIPLIHFRNRPVSHNDYGLSEIENAIPLQNILNRTLYSMTYAAETGAFRIYVALGFDPGEDMTPGTIIKVYKEGMGADEKADFTALEGASPQPYIEQAVHLIDAIHDVTATPRYDTAGANASGENIKQRDAPLLGKVQRFQTYTGNAWEDAMSLSLRVQNTFGERVPEVANWSARWASAEIRNDNDIIKNALEQFKAGAISQRSYLEMIAPVYDWDAARIEKELDELRAEKQQNFADLAGSLPGVGDSLQPSPNGGGLMLDQPQNEEEAA